MSSVHRPNRMASHRWRVLLRYTYSAANATHRAMFAMVIAIS